MILQLQLHRKRRKVFHHFPSFFENAKKSRREQSLLFIPLLLLRNKQRKLSAIEIISRLILILVSVPCLFLLPINLIFFFFLFFLIPLPV